MSEGSELDAISDNKQTPQIFTFLKKRKLYTEMYMKKTSLHILRIGLAVTFLWIGVLIIKNQQ